MNEAQEVYNSDIDLNDPAYRKYIVKQLGLMGFCLVYLRHYFGVEPAEFHYLLALLLSDASEELIEIIGFRGSAKSTFATLGLPLYLALEHLNEFIVVGGDTTTQTQLNIANIRYELEHNERIAEDYGIVFNPEKAWSQDKLMLLNGVLIMGRSRGQKMRGLRHRQFRPQTVIIDDPEDLEWVKTKKNRDKTERWFTSEVIPAQQEDKSKLILIGNLLHKDALMLRIYRKKRASGEPLFKCVEFPLIDAEGNVTWRGKYPDEASIQKQKEKIGSQTAWSREYLLKILSEEDQIIKETQLHYYKNSLIDERDDNGNKKHKPIDAGVGNDLAISEKQTADFTAMVAGIKLKFKEEAEKIFILPNPVNLRVGFDGMLKEATKLNGILPFGVKWYVEAVGYQKAAIEKMKKTGLAVYEMTPISDKRARLETVSPFIIDGTVVFPEYGCEELLEQLLGFGSEEHDDLVDALVYLIMGMVKRRVFTTIERPDKI